MDILENFNEILKTPEDYEIKKDLIKDIVDSRNYNKKIVDYFIDYSLDRKARIPITMHRAGEIESCNKYFCLDIYMNEMIKDFKSTNLCKSKFCNNCKKVKQASRMSRYIPHLEPYKEFNYHLVLTIPNVNGIDLKNTIDKMNHAFKSLIRYFNGHKRIEGINFSKYGYIGAIKSVEITFKGDSYHPHFHVLLGLKSRGVEEAIYENKYSYSTANGYRKFTALEILIQKVWYLLINDIEVNLKNINNLDLGYSCILDKFLDDDYIELFKYLTKDFDDKKNILTYDNFVVLYESTYRLKQIQGYGIFYNIIDENLDEEVEREYLAIVNLLKELDEPYEVLQRSEDLLKDPYTIISRKKIYNIIRELKKDG